MNDEGRPVRITPINHITEVDANKNGADSLNFGLAEMKEYKRYHLYKYRHFSQFFFKTEEEKTSIQEFPGQHICNRLEGVYKRIELV